MGITGQSGWKVGPPLQAGITFAHNAYCYRCPFGLNYPSCEIKCAQDVQELIRTTTTGQIAGMIAEPIQGVGGFITPPKEYFGIVADIVRKHGGIFISDEVQTAWGRTGNKWWGIEQWGVTPDMITSAKGLANGFPIGLTAARREVADGLKKLTISTFGGGPISTVAAKAVLDLMSRPAAFRVMRPSSSTLIRPSRFSRRMAMATAGALTFSHLTSVAAITTSPSLSASAMDLT